MIQGINQRRKAQGGKQPTQRAGEVHGAQHCDTPAVVAGNRCPVFSDQPPGIRPLVRWDGCQQHSRFLIRTAQQRQRLPAIDEGDDPRRPTAKPSTSVVNQHRSKQHYDSSSWFFPSLSIFQLDHFWFHFSQSSHDPWYNFPII
jgi:hypothetical protein